MDHLAPQQGAFAHALEWAWHLRLPIHAWALPAVVSTGSLPGGIEHSDQGSHARFPAPPSDEFVAEVNACAKVCADLGVKLGLTPMEGDPDRWFRQHLQPDDLLMVSYRPAATERFALIRQVLLQIAAVLICPEVWRSTLSRMLVLYRSWEQSQDALATAMALCHFVRATPVVLTVARSEREGRRLQQPARAAFAAHGQSGNFDLLIGAEVAEAAARVARWRQCQLLVMGRYGRRPWTRWVGGSTTERLIGLADSLAVLTIPKRVAFDISPEPRHEMPALAEPIRSRAGGRAPERKVGGT